MIQIAILLAIGMIGVILFVKLRNSKIMDKITHDVIYEDDDAVFHNTGELIENAQKADEALINRADENAETIKKIKNETR